MCAPALAAIGPLVSAGASMAGAAMSAQGEKDAAEAKARQLEYNAKVARINAQTERLTGQRNRETEYLKFREHQGEVVAAAAASGVDPFFGSAMAIFSDNQAKHNMDQSTRYNETESKATAHINQAQDFEAQAAAERTAGDTRAKASILSGIGGAASSIGGAFKGLGGGGGGGALFING